LVPKIIHQIWIGEEPEMIVEARKTVKELNPDFTYMFWDESNTAEFFTKKDEENSTHIAHLCNVIKVNIISKYGGIYIDADVICLVPLEEWFCKYKNKRLSSYFIQDTYPETGVIIAEPKINFYLALVDYIPNAPMVFYWQRMKPSCIPESEVGKNGTILKDLRLNSWT